MVYTNNEFKGFYPVGASAIVVADSKKEAADLLNQKLKKIGLPKSAKPEQFHKIKTRTKGVIILNNGNY